ncbi:MAG: hypothetical protein Q7S45_00610 [Candidatus Curtissbacteria bacterium]|nr:hypothetical protein [Candidatus Curtissbacteria bacterium]
MKYLAQSDIWKLEQAIGNNQTIKTRVKSRELARFRQLFPLTVFPDKIVIEEHRVIWIQNNGPWMDQVITIMATDIACVNAATGPLFGQVHVKSLTGGPEIFVDRLLKHDVYKIRGLIEGIVLGSRGGLEIDDECLEIEREALLTAGEVN